MTKSSYQRIVGLPIQNVNGADIRGVPQFDMLTLSRRFQSDGRQTGYPSHDLVGWVLLATMVVCLGCSRPPAATPANTDPNQSSNRSTAIADPSGPQEGSKPAADTDASLWASPTDGGPLDIRYLPAATQALIALRPREILGHPETTKGLRALGPDFKAFADGWQQNAGLELSSIEELVLAFIPQATGSPRLVSIITLVQPPSDALLSTRSIVTLSPRVYRSGKELLWIPDGNSRVVVLGNEVEISRLIETGSPPPLPRAVEQMVAVSDGRRQLSVLISPQLFITTGSRPSSVAGQHLQKLVQWICDDQVRALAFSMHVDQQAYVEFRFATLAEAPSRIFAHRLRRQMREWPPRLRQYLDDQAEPYWQKLASRYPDMIEFLLEHTRIGVEDQQTVVNCVMPSEALHNVILASEIALSSLGTGWTP